jgi:hypothetical protein
MQGEASFGTLVFIKERPGIKTQYVLDILVQNASSLNYVGQCIINYK